MTERPILFSPPMVRAVLDGRKTQTRRPVKNPDYFACLTGDCPHQQQAECNADLARRAPYGSPGDQLWGREAFCACGYGQANDGMTSRQSGERVKISEADYAVLKDGAQKHRSGKFTPGLAEYAPGAFDYIKWRPGIHMPRWASRITLGITDVRVERLNDITEADALAEGVVWSERWQAFVVPGVEHPNKDFPVLSRATAREMYAALWDTINGSGEWLGNPWVWVVSFERA